MQQPIAAASIGQVHRARLADGRAVAVKVQRPGLEAIIDLDMALLKIFLESISSLLPPTDLNTITAEIERSVREELLRALLPPGSFHRKFKGFNPVEGSQ